MTMSNKELSLNSTLMTLSVIKANKTKPKRHGTKQKRSGAKHRNNIGKKQNKNKTKGKLKHYFDCKGIENVQNKTLRI